MLEVHIADAHQKARCGFERFANHLAHVYPRGSCGRCIDCSGLSSHVHSVSSSGSVRLDEFEQWWPAGLQSPTLYYHIKARQLKYQFSLATRRATEWRDTAFGQSDLLHKRGMQQMPLHVPAAYTNIQKNERVVFVKQIKVTLELRKAACLRSPFALLSHTATPASFSCDQTVAFSSEEKTGEVQTAADFAASVIPCLSPPSTHPISCARSCFAEASAPDCDSSCQLSGNDSSTSSIGYAYHQPTKRTRTASGALPSHICTGHFLAPAVPASLAQSCQVSSTQAAPACRTPARNTLLDGATAVTELRPVPGTAKRQERDIVSSCRSSRDVIIPMLQSNVKAGGGLCSPVLDGHLVGHRVSMGNARDATSNAEEGTGGGWFGQWLASWLDVNA